MNLEKEPNSIPRTKSSSTTGSSNTAVAIQRKPSGTDSSGIGSPLKTVIRIDILEKRICQNQFPGKREVEIRMRMEAKLLE